LPISPRHLIHSGKSGRGKVTDSEKVKEPRKTKAAPREKTPKAKEPVQKKQQATPQAKEPVQKKQPAAPQAKVLEKAAAKKAAVKKAAPKKAAARKDGPSSPLEQLDGLKRENEELRAQLAAANARADRLFIVTGDVVSRLDSVITLIRGLVEG
jgi:hypothetical protein